MKTKHIIAEKAIQVPNDIFQTDSTSTPYSNQDIDMVKRFNKKKRKCKSDNDCLVQVSPVNAYSPKVKRKKIEYSVKAESSDESSDKEISENQDYDSLSYGISQESDDSLYDEPLDTSLTRTSSNFAEILRKSEEGCLSDSYVESDDFEEKKRELCESKVISPEQKQNLKRYKIYTIPSKNLMIVLLNHPASLTLYKYVSVQVLTGSISICGHNLHSDKPAIKVFSSEKTGFIGLKTLSFDKYIYKDEHFLILKRKLKSIVKDKIKVKKILDAIGNSTVIVTVQELIFPTKFQFLQLYSCQLQFDFIKDCKSIRYAIKNKKTAMEYDFEAESVENGVFEVIRRTKFQRGPPAVILVYGPKNAGKSSLLRFLINKVQDNYSPVFYLDADPGQTEFTPPGTVSLTKIEEPIIGPIFCRKQKPVSMVFIGSTSAESNPSMYIKSISKLLSVYRKHFPREILFINTMGWLKGIGVECLQQIIKQAQPTLLCEVVVDKSPVSFDLKSCLQGQFKYFKVDSPVQKDGLLWKAPDLSRNLAILTYFSKCQISYLKPMYLNEMKPVCVSWDKIPIYIFGRKVPPNRIVEAVNASLVALCHVDEKEVLVSKIPDFQTTLRDEPLNDCLGFGIVRAIDEGKHLLHIVTPLNLKELQNVNAIIRGDVKLPDSVFLAQNITGVPLPFTKKSSDFTTGITKNLRKKVHGRCVRGPPNGLKT